MTHYTALEQAAIDLHDYLWNNMGHTDDYPIQFSADNEEDSDHFIALLNKLQDEIKAKTGNAYQP